MWNKQLLNSYNIITGRQGWLQGRPKLLFILYAFNQSMKQEGKDKSPYMNKNAFHKPATLKEQRNGNEEGYFDGVDHQHDS